MQWGFLQAYDMFLFVCGVAKRGEGEGEDTGWNRGKLALESQVIRCFRGCEKISGARGATLAMVSERWSDLRQCSASTRQMSGVSFTATRAEQRREARDGSECSAESARGASITTRSVKVSSVRVDHR